MRRTHSARRSSRGPSASAAGSPPLGGAGRWDALTAYDLMRKDVVTLAATDSLAEVKRVLADQGVGGAPVVDASGAIVGVVSLRDLAERSSEDEDSARPPRENGFYGLASDESVEDDLESFELPADAGDTAADVMTAEVLSVPADASLAEIARAMTKHRVHRLLVTQDGRYVGIVGTLEVLAALAS